MGRKPFCVAGRRHTFHKERDNKRPTFLADSKRMAADEAASLFQSSLKSAVDSNGAVLSRSSIVRREAARVGRRAIDLLA